MIPVHVGEPSRPPPVAITSFSPGEACSMISAISAKRSATASIAARSICTGVLLIERPAMVPLASSAHPGPRSPASRGRKVSPWESGCISESKPLRLFLIWEPQRLPQPGHEVPAVGERAAHDEPLRVRPVAPRPVGYLHGVCLPEHPHRAARAHHERQTIVLRAPASDVGAGPVADGREPGNLAQGGPPPGPLIPQARERLVRDRGELRVLDGQSLQDLRIPTALILVEEPGRRGHRGAHTRSRRRIARRSSRRGRPNARLASKIPGPLTAQPQQLCGPVARVEHAPRAAVDRRFVEPFA